LQLGLATRTVHRNELSALLILSPTNFARHRRSTLCAEMQGTD
jgi:hypothetical protein